MITTIIFDLSEVLLRGLYGTHEKLSEYLRQKVESDEFFIKEIQDLFEGKIIEDEYWGALLKNRNWAVEVDDLKKLVRDNFKEIEGTRAIVQNLRQNGYKLGLLSVHAKEWIDHCEKEFDYHALFDSKMYSFEVAVCKPDVRAYQLILEKLSARPEECLFIDDSMENIKAAKQLGINVIQFESVQQLSGELRQLGLL